VLNFAFATGIENSAPRIAGGKRVDELESCGFYRHWRTDFAIVKELGIQFLRYGPPLHRTWLGDGRYDWEFADMTMAELHRLRIFPIVDLCHFGIPDWLGDFQNPDFPELFGRYAQDFALRYPWVQLYTPVNEIFVCARFSAALGWWNEQLKAERPFFIALKHLTKANVLAIHKILEVTPDAIFIQSESTEQFHPDCPEAEPFAEAYNSARFLSLDLSYGRQVNTVSYVRLRENGMSAEEYDWFMQHGVRRRCVMGNDYYHTNEHWVDRHGVPTSAGEIVGYAEITRQYFGRYRLPIMHTETNLDEGPTGYEAEEWLSKQWANVMQLRRAGLPVIGFTWYSLTDQVDWDCSLRFDRGTVNPRGLYDLDRNPRAVGRAFKRLVESWSDTLAARSIALTLPLRPFSDDA
jgi:beta-glucosidase/6-phospho-beta-glucosidase/beta-galactosidase